MLLLEKSDRRIAEMSEEDIRMAKEMELNPKSLIKNIPNPKEQWKAPVKLWIRDMYETRQIKAARKKRRKEAETSKAGI